VPQDEVRRINEAGGKLKEGAKGVNEEEYFPAAKLGVTKVNIDTDGRLVWTRVHREFFRDKPEDFDLRTPGKIFIRNTPTSSRTRTRSWAAPARSTMCVRSSASN
jgi:fructose-bisphosphate aldolase class II